MSIEVDWNRLTDGSDGEALAETIRSFIHERFQQVQLPRFIRSVKAHSFQFGDVTPQVQVKDVCDPMPDFYESDDEDDDEESPDDAKRGGSNQEQALSGGVGQEGVSLPAESLPNLQTANERPEMPKLDTIISSKEAGRETMDSPISTTIPRASTTGIPGGTSNLSYFHLPLSAGLSGASTPIGAPNSRFGGSLLGHLHQNSLTSNGSFSLPSVAPPTQPESHGAINEPKSSSPQEDTANDLQIVAHIKYDGNVRLSLTAEVAFDYPMESFVGISLQLNVTGLTFDGVAILAYIKRKAHFCFLAPEDAEALIGNDSNETLDEDGADGSNAPSELRDGGHKASSGTQKPVGGLFEEIRVESEIGEREKGKQVLKNIGKVEKFVLDQVRRIFENELVYPSFWTFLV